MWQEKWSLPLEHKSQERKFTDSEISHRKIPICDVRSAQNRKSAYYNHRPPPSQVLLFAICDHRAIVRSQHHTIAISHFRHMVFSPVVSCSVGPESKIGVSNWFGTIINTKRLRCMVVPLAELTTSTRHLHMEMHWILFIKSEGLNVGLKAWRT